MRANNQQGFTLMELLISMAVMSVIVAITAQSFWLGFQSVEKGEGVIEHDLTLRSVVSLISKQLRSIYPFMSGDKNEKKVLRFSGESDSLSFVTSLPIGLQKRGGLFRVNYFLVNELSGRKVLKASQKSVYSKKAFDHGSKADGIPILTNLLEPEWTYFKEGEWRNHWDGEEQQQLPERVKLTFKRLEGKKHTIYEIRVPISVESKEEQVGLKGRLNKDQGPVEGTK